MSAFVPIWLSYFATKKSTMGKSTGATNDSRIIEPDRPRSNTDIFDVSIDELSKWLDDYENTYGPMKTDKDLANFAVHITDDLPMGYYPSLKLSGLLFRYLAAKPGEE